MINDVDRELSAVEVRKTLSEKALMEIRKNINKWKLTREARTAAKAREKSKKERHKSNFANDVGIQVLGSCKGFPSAGEAMQEAA